MSALTSRDRQGAATLAHGFRCRLLTRAALWLIPATLLAAVDGTVVNRTKGQPQPGATVTLYKLGGAGMEAVESVKSDGEGKFRIEQTPQGPHLIQTAWDGVTYNHMLPPGAPLTGLALEVFDARKQPGEAKVVQHVVLFEPSADTLSVSETFFYRNQGKTSYNDPDGGTLRFYLPPGARNVKVTAQAPQGMPIERAAEKAGPVNVYKVDFPIKPGESRLDVMYALPFSSSATFSSKVLYKGGPTRLVAPAGVTLKGQGLESLGQEPTTQASIYSTGAAEFQVEIAGAGSLQAASQGESEDGPSIEQMKPWRVYDRLPWILGLTFAALGIGFLLLYRSGEPSAQRATPSPARDRRRG